MAHKLYIGTNTKMYKGISETCAYLSALGELTADIDRNECEIFVIPSFTTLESAYRQAQKAQVRLGGQNMGWEAAGQYTGEISPLMLREVGVEIVQIGHSERRQVFYEDDEMENRKVLCALQHGFTALLCIGETEKQKNFSLSGEVLRTQLKVGLQGVEPQDICRLWIAYEPVWAIGVNGKPAGKEYASQMHLLIRKTLEELFGRQAAKQIPILYGGSVNRQNADDLICMPDIDGLFIGRSAWDAEPFSEIIHHVLPHFQKCK
ncbi:MAG: triose-phosphate isomerase [Acetanaerobacterium sp.]